jgi:phosphatidylglycerol---prolipoprotein diacylglyceryl transferase
MPGLSLGFEIPVLALVLPYIQLPSIPLPFGSIHPFGIFAALGVYIGARLTVWAARVYGPGDAQPLVGVFPWALGGGLVGAHLLHVLGYHPEALRTGGPLVLLKIWDGVSSIGGALGGMAGIALYFRKHRLRLRPYLDAIALGVAPGWAIARIGCSVVHDHPGVLSQAWLAVNFPGGPRLDMGLLDFVLLAALTLVLYLLSRRHRPAGFLAGVLTVGYCVPRFFLDFYRANDLAFVDGRIGGLTPAQWITPVLAAIGVYLLVSKPAEAPAQPTPSAGDLAETRVDERLP